MLGRMDSTEPGQRWWLIEIDGSPRGDCRFAPLGLRESPLIDGEMSGRRAWTIWSL